MSNLNFLLFGVYPFVALAVLVIGCWARFDLSQYTWKAGSSQFLHDRNFRIASVLFHVGILFILAGHFVGLLIPEAIYHHVISTSNKQLLAMVSGGIFGTLCLIGLLMLIHRRMFNPRVRASSSASDILVLWVLLAQLLLGLATIPASAGHMDGSVMVMLANWAQYTVTFQPALAAAAIEPVSLVYKLHVFLGLSLFVLFPFTRLVHIVSAPVWYLVAVIRLSASRPASHSRKVRQPRRRPETVMPGAPGLIDIPVVNPGAAIGTLGGRPVAQAPRQE